jgi:hypothetical protein
MTGAPEAFCSIVLPSKHQHSRFYSDASDVAARDLPPKPGPLDDYPEGNNTPVFSEFQDFADSKVVRKITQENRMRFHKVANLFSSTQDALLPDGARERAEAFFGGY